MIKKLRVTVDGHTYEVVVELPDDAPAPALAIGPLPTVQAPAAVPPVISPPTPTPTPAATAPAVTSAPAASPGDVPSPLAGRVTAVVVTPGQTVKEGDH